jgi:hypothetical protein
MIVAGAPSTENVTVLSVRAVPAPPGILMLALRTLPRNAEGRKEGRAPRRWVERDQRQYKGRGSVGSGQSEGRVV